MNELSKDVKVTKGVIEFGGYQKLKQEALDLVDNLQGVEVTEDSISINKKLVAEVRKKANELDSTRKLVKKEVMEPLLDYEERVKEILAIVKQGEDTVRVQLNEYERERKASKRLALNMIWDLRGKKYPDVLEYRSFDDFLDESMLNKTYSIDKAEEDMANYLQVIKQELIAINGQLHADEILVEYKDNNLSTAMSNVASRYAKLEKVKEVKQESKILTSFEKNVKVFKQGDYDLIVAFCKANDIKFI